jgi:hypothetical protein
MTVWGVASMLTGDPDATSSPDPNAQRVIGTLW